MIGVVGVLHLGGRVFCMADNREKDAKNILMAMIQTESPYFQALRWTSFAGLQIWITMWIIDRRH